MVAQSIQQLPAAPAGDGVPAGNQQLKNGTFADTAEPWWRSVPEIGLLRQDGKLRAEVPGGTAKQWDRVVGYTGFTLTKGRRYGVEFDITGCEKRHVKVAVQHADPPYYKTVEDGVEVDQTMRRASLEFTSTISTSDGALNFLLGGHPHDCWFLFDNVSLVELLPPQAPVAAEEPR